MKKIFLCLLILFNCVALASDKLHLRALEDFNSKEPKEVFRAELIEDGSIDGMFLFKGDKINCTLLKVKDPKRAKIDAKVYFNIVSTEDSDGVHLIDGDYCAKYAKKVINKEAIKEIPKKNILKTAAGAAGGVFVKGFSYGVSFVDGVITNNDSNRLKSGVKQVYDDSLLSYVEYGDEIDIKTDDTFYFIIKEKKD